ncbi:hypothetical protein PG991_015216 [Apiospora marii]|uniref:Uncharacterized protein n=1 Tax=Apiospora marii TaxID=335849 RepID=A0ABR1R1Q8_9PEZI
MKFTLTSVLALLLATTALAAPSVRIRGCNADNNGDNNNNDVSQEQEQEQESDGGFFGDNAITLEQANTGDFEPGTPVVDEALNLNEGESCTTTSTQGVLGCGDGTGANFNIVDGERRI